MNTNSEANRIYAAELDEALQRALAMSGAAPLVETSIQSFGFTFQATRGGEPQHGLNFGVTAHAGNHATGASMELYLRHGREEPAATINAPSTDRTLLETAVHLEIQQRLLSAAHHFLLLATPAHAKYVATLTEVEA